LLFLKRLDDLKLAKEGKAQRLEEAIENPIFSEQKKQIRWWYFKKRTKTEEILKILRDEAKLVVPNSVVENDPRWKMFGATGIVDAIWDGLGVKLVPRLK
jgi:hypothetical protein